MTPCLRLLGGYLSVRGYRIANTIAIICGILFLLFSLSSSASAVTTVPTKMNFQGRLTDASGNIKPNGSYNMRLKLYTVSTAGTNVWSEDRLVSATQGVTVTNGLFTIQLGDITTLPASLFASGSLYLEVELPTPASATTSSPVWTEGAMTPRNQMATSAYAYNAETLDGLDSAEFAQIGASNTFTGINAFNGSTFSIGGAANTAKFNVASLFNVNSTDSIVSIGVSNTTGTVLVLDTKTDAGDPTGGSAVNGAMYYNSNAGKFRCYQAAAWTDCVGAGSGASLSANNTFTGTNLFRNGTNSTSAFGIQDSSSVNLFNVGTSDQTVTIGTAGNFDTMTKLADPATLPTDNAGGTAFSPDGQYMSVAHYTTPYITIYKRSGDTFTKLADPATLPTGTGNGTAFSLDGQYMSVAHNTSPYITIYKRSGDTFTKLADPATLPASTSNGTAFSPDGQYMSVAHYTTPYITIYKRSGDTFTKLADPATLPASSALDTAFSPDGQYMSVAHDTSPYITIYKRSGDTFTKLANPATLPTGTGNGTAFSLDGQYMSVAHQTSPYITIYKRSGDTFTKLANPATLPGSAATGTAFSPDGQYMSVAYDSTPYMIIYKRSGDTFTKLADPATMPAGTSNGTAFSPDGQYMSIAHSTSPYITIYKASGQKVSTDMQGSVNVSNNFTANNATITNTLSTNNLLATGSANIIGDMLAGNGLFSVNTADLSVRIGQADTTGYLFVLDTKTDAGDPSGTVGAMYYNSNASKFRCYQAGAWTDCIGAGGGASLSANNTFTGTNLFRNSTNSTAAFGIQDSSSVSLFNADTVNNIVRIGNATADGVGVVFVLDTKNTAGDPTGASAIAGAMYYNSNAGKFRCNEAGTWTDCISGGIVNTIVLKTTGDVSNSTTTGADVTGLTWAVVANTDYSFECGIIASSAATTTGIRMAVNGPASPTQVTTYISVPVAATSADVPTTQTAFETYTANTAAVTTRVMVTIKGVTRIGATAGDIHIRFRSEVASSAVTIYRGSTCRVY